MINYQDLKDAVCLTECPVAGQAVPCLVEPNFCPSGTYTAAYDSVTIDSYCVPSEI